eukprot:CAMPEP_0113591252 /NCGR_PEP_ID=MMETSP0015_2-20120614/37165_1 /TAXON_ID=2838 /ORGANISM="Odontella" /LENGTH=122 /DNA_ID=CAMNT_0000497611 /DNA_START=152 /DNA_END=517 /DNA_ORIENTATION=+ /assembly_acc=CAM_ASM_000160
MSKPPPPPVAAATVASLPTPPSGDGQSDLRDRLPTSRSKDSGGEVAGDDYYSCPPFPTEDDYDAYVSRISPRRELVCPITQEVFRDPVVALDGHTYERTSLLMWFQTHRNGGTMRSPTTNAL